MDGSEQALVDQILRGPDRALWIVTAADGPRRGGLLVSFLTPASLDPAQPRLLAGIAPNHFTHELIVPSRAFAAHLLRSDQVELAWRFASTSGRTHDKLADLPHARGLTGSPLLSECQAQLEARVVTAFPAGDRTYFLAEIVHGARFGSGPPLTEQGFFAQLTSEQKARLRADLQVELPVSAALWNDFRAGLS